MQEFIHVLLGISLSAACGFRVFIPFLALSIANINGWITLSSGFEWIGSQPALIVFSVASVVEIAAYYIPWLDNMLDTIASPLAVIAGIATTASLTGDLDPIFRWTVSIIAGGSVSGIIQAATASLRMLSTATTGGLGNPVVSTAEAGSAAVISISAILVPIFAFCVVLLVLGWAGWKLYKKVQSSRSLMKSS